MPVRPLAALTLALVCAGAADLLFVPDMHASFIPVVFARYLQLDFGVTPLALPFLCIVALVGVPVAIWSLARGRAGDGFRLAIFAAAIAGVLLARSVLAFAVFWELMSLSSAFLVAAGHRRREARRAVFAYMLVSQLGALAIVTALAIAALHVHSAAFADIAAGARSLAPGTRLAVIVLAILGFGSKAGLVPLQFWLPRAHPAAPANASALLSAVMLKIAVYGLLLTCFVLAAPAPASAGAALIVLGAASALVGALYASIESETKRLLAYSSIENVGIIVAAIGLAVQAYAGGHAALAALALCGALLHAVNHAAFKGLLFLGAGTIVERMHHVTDLDRLGGLAAGPLARTAPLVLVGCMAAGALPPLNGFVSEWVILQAFVFALPSGSIAFAVLVIGAIAALASAGGLAAAAFVKFYGTAFLGARRETHEPIAREPFDAAVAGIGVLAAICVVLGVAPALAFDPLSAVAARLLGVAPTPLGALSWVPLLAALPVLCGAGAMLLARSKRLRRVPTWSCGSPVGLRSQYSATVLTKPIRLIFAFALLPQRQRVIEMGGSPWRPVRIAYEVSTRYLVDEAARGVAAAVQRISRRTRVIQGGRLRVYLTYALVTFALMLVLAR